MKSSDPVRRLVLTLARWQKVRVISGVSAILSVVFMIGAMIVAFWGGEDTSIAMKAPFLFSLACLLVFTRSVRRILEIEAALRP